MSRCSCSRASRTTTRPRSSCSPAMSRPRATGTAIPHRRAARRSSCGRARRSSSRSPARTSPVPPPASSTSWTRSRSTPHNLAAGADERARGAFGSPVARRISGVPLHVVTAGESHGPGLTTIVEGLPAGLELSQADIDSDLARRQLGHGRGGRMKIEKDAASVTAGVRHGRTLGGPVALQVANRDYKNWEERMNPWPVEAVVPEVHLPRPGHADLAGVQKYGFSDVRNVLERASARETAARVAGGALVKAFLRELGVEVRSHVTQIGSVRAPASAPALAGFDGVDDSPVRCLDAQASRDMVQVINVL